jgi:hypothetical protein
MTDKEKYLEFWGYLANTPEAEEAWVAKCAMMSKNETSAAIMMDIQPYKSMVTGEMITGKRAHREHLRKHNLIEVGNEQKHLIPQEKRQDQKLKRQIAEQVYEKLRY